MTLSALSSYLHELNFVSMLIRLLLAALGGGIIGYSRGKTRHAAGLRTHILVCLGSAAVVIAGIFFCERVNANTDPLRLPAQVISGVGFLGAGSILVTESRQVTGLTTAAGLWASACMGIACGAGYYSCAVVMCALILVVLVLLTRLDDLYVKSSRIIHVYFELSPDTALSSVMIPLQASGVKVHHIEPFSGTPAVCSFIAELERPGRSLSRDAVLQILRSVPGLGYCTETNSNF